MPFNEFFRNMAKEFEPVFVNTIPKDLSALREMREEVVIDTNFLNSTGYKEVPARLFLACPPMPYKNSTFFARLHGFPKGKLIGTAFVVVRQREGYFLFHQLLE